MGIGEGLKWLGGELGEGDIRKALDEIQGLDFITAPTGLLRVEE